MPIPVMTQNSAQTAPLISTVTPAALVVAKPLEPQHTLTLSNQPANMKPILTTVSNMKFYFLTINIYIANTNHKTYKL